MNYVSESKNQIPSCCSKICLGREKSLQILKVHHAFNLNSLVKGRKRSSIARSDAYVSSKRTGPIKK